MVKQVLGALAVLLISVAIAAVARLVLKYHRPKKVDPELASRLIEEHIPTFRVVALGLQGAGKTLLLASMYKTMQGPSQFRRFYLRASDEDASRLREHYKVMADTSDSWPEGTAPGDQRTFRFSVRTQVNGPVVEAVRIDYLEYPGELLSDTREASKEARAELGAAIRGADALICVLDGHAILDYCESPTRGWSRLEESVSVFRHHLIESRGPINFVISKWDLLTGLGANDEERLTTIRDVLMSNDDFHNLIATKRDQQIIRLVPVSATGEGFARIDRSGHVVKILNSKPSPTNTDIPLSAVVPDIFRQAEENLDRSMHGQLSAEFEQYRRTPLTKRIAGAIDVATRPATTAFLQAIGGNTLAGSLLQGAGGTVLELALARQGSQPVEADPAASQEWRSMAQEIQAFHTSRATVMRDMQRKVDELEFKMPNSQISRYV